MTIEQIKSVIGRSEKTQQLLSVMGRLRAGEGLPITGIAGSLKALVLCSIMQEADAQILLIGEDRDSAQRLRDDFDLTLGGARVSYFDGHRTHTSTHTDHALPEDVQTLRALLEGSAGVVITHPAAVISRLPTPSLLKGRAFAIETGKEASFTKLVARLAELGFEKKPFVETYGDYSVRGGIIDVFPFVGENPVRVELFGDTVESIREFDPLSQRSIKDLAAATLVPDLLSGGAAGDVAAAGYADNRTASLLDYIKSDAFVVLQEPPLIQKTIEEHALLSSNRVLTWSELSELLTMFRQIHLHTLSPATLTTLDFGAFHQPALNSSVKILKKRLIDLQAQAYNIVITCDTPSEQARLKDMLEAVDLREAKAGAHEPTDDPEFPETTSPVQDLDLSLISFSLEALHGGFILPDVRLALFTEHQIFNRLKRRGKKRKQAFRGFTAKELHQLRKGDYVVHADYGIGRFDGLKRIQVRGVEQEVLRLLYEEKDVLYINLNYVNKIQKYSSKEGHLPKLTRLGTPEWEKLKARAKKRVKDIARDLITLYARRKHEPGIAFHKDTLWQRELEASFMYEDTFDQAKATYEVKQDMEAPHPMDRLICGDVGFGKTEIAVRAAFKAVMSGKQVAVLVPTTILAMQHYNTFVDRMSRYSTNIQFLSRFKSKGEQAEILARLRAGSIDIIIGTHRLLSRDVAFRDLGLLVVDEEHRFGVSAKEKLRQLRATVDTLTLTATPIPRTLHFSLMGARDLSIIATPPRNRLPVITEISQPNDDLIRDALLREVQHGGQVYFVHDRVNTIADVTIRLRSLLPGLRIRLAHGQMHAHDLEEVMVDFMEKKIDVLVCTKIIESGLDMPNVNTIVINRADRFGMAELYQLRGRVGRSNVQAYAYLLTPPLSVLPRQALQRLQAVEEFTELGSGFNLAMRDLEIRGAGNLLGAEQSGFIETMGFEMYTRILAEAVAELKREEFQDLFERDATLKAKRDGAVVEAHLDVFIPEDYVADDTERLVVYRRLYALDTPEQLDEAARELKDRFGRFPQEVGNLFGAVRLRLVATTLGFKKVKIDAEKLEIDFPPETDTEFYEADSFQAMMVTIASMKREGVALRQDGKSLKLIARMNKKSDMADMLQQADRFMERIAESAGVETEKKER